MPAAGFKQVRTEAMKDPESCPVLKNHLCETFQGNKLNDSSLIDRLDRLTSKDDVSFTTF